MKKTIVTLLLILFYTTFLNAQSITGNLSQLINQPIKLEGFNGLKTYPISSSIIDEKAILISPMLKPIMELVT